MNRAAAHRRELHQIPETSYEEFKTKEYILSVLKDLNCEVIEVLSTGVCAWFNKGKEKTVAFRADMDALPIQEETGLPFASKHPGKMHACGHDGHMAILLGFAEELSQLPDSAFKNNVLLVFQPSEETVGGADPICKSGIFEKTNTKGIFGTHVYPFLAKGAIGSRPKEFMACCSEVTMTVRGKSTHCAEPNKGIDSVEIAAELLCRLYKMEREEIDPKEYRILKFGLFQGGTVRNILPEITVMKGSYRSFYPEVFNFMIDRTNEIIKELETKFGCTIEFEHTDGYPALLNDEGMFNTLKETLSNDFEFVQYEEPFMIAEDFAFYCKKMPGCFMYLGTGTGIALHNCQFDFDEEILQNGIQAYLKLMNIEKGLAD